MTISACSAKAAKGLLIRWALCHPIDVRFQRRLSDHNPLADLTEWQPFGASEPAQSVGCGPQVRCGFVNSQQITLSNWLNHSRNRCIYGYLQSKGPVGIIIRDGRTLIHVTPAIGGPVGTVLPGEYRY